MSDSFDSFLCICSCCGVSFDNSDGLGDFDCCMYRHCPLSDYSYWSLSDYPYWSCSNCVCIFHLEVWDNEESEKEKLRQRNLVMKTPIKYCCLKRASLAYLTEEKNFGIYRDKLVNFVEKLNPDLYDFRINNNNENENENENENKSKRQKLIK